MKRPLVAFDTDGTLIDENDQPREDVIQLLKLLSKFTKVMVWSGNGKDYAELWVNRLGLAEHVFFIEGKIESYIHPDIAFDDMPDFNMATVNIIVREHGK